jgi:hypothetical protein
VTISGSTTTPSSRLDRVAGDRSTIVPGPNAIPDLFAGDAIWVAGYPEDAITILDRAGRTEAVMTTPLVVRQMQSTRAGVFVLGGAGADTQLERRAPTGEVEVSVTVPDAWEMTADGTAVWLAVVTDYRSNLIEIVTLDPTGLEAVGRVTVRGRRPPCDGERRTRSNRGRLRS